MVQCTGPINNIKKNPLHLFSVYAVKESEKGVVLFYYHLYGEMSSELLNLIRKSRVINKNADDFFFFAPKQVNRSTHHKNSS